MERFVVSINAEIDARLGCWRLRLPLDRTMVEMVSVWGRSEWTPRWLDYKCIYT